MKNMLAKTTLVVSLAFSTAAFAGFNMGGGFEGPVANQAKVTAAEAAKLSDDTNVVLTGKIEQKLGDEKYMFRDNSGTIIVEIDNEDWKGVTVTPQDTVEIYGEVDTDMFEPSKVDVDTIIKK